MSARTWSRWGMALGLLLAGTAQAATVVKYVHTDALGSVVAVTDAARTVIEQRKYEPYGQQLPGVQAGPGYTGHVQDVGTGLVYMQQRYYDPGIGRFLSVDPVTANGGTGANFNRYWYANNSPYKFVDPDGRQVKKPEANTSSRAGGKSTSGVYGGQGNAGIYTIPGVVSSEGRGALERAAKAKRYVDAVGPAVEREVRDSPEESADLFRAVFQYMSTRLRLEFGAKIIPSEVSLEGWQLRDIVISQKYDPTTGIGYDIIIQSIEGGYDAHTHPYVSNMSKWFHPFSSEDVDIVNRFKLNSFVSQPDHSIYMLSAGGYPEKIK